MIDPISNCRDGRVYEGVPLANLPDFRNNVESISVQYSLRSLLVFVTWAAAIAGLAARFGTDGIVCGAAISMVIACLRPSVSKDGRILSIAAALFLGWMIDWRPFSGAQVFDPIEVCKVNQHHIGRALLRYETSQHALPPAFTKNALGERQNSWRLSLLPYLDHARWYESIDSMVSLPHEEQMRISGSAIAFFQCCDELNPRTPTSYVAIVGPGFAFQGEIPVSVAEITDQRNQTILFVEFVNSGIEWMEPRDLLWEAIESQQSPLSKASHHPEGVVATFADGSQRILPPNISSNHLRALLTIAGSEDMSWLQQPKSTW